MTLSQLFIGFFYYGIIYMGLSVIATVLINRVVKRYFTAPLIINAAGVIILALMVWLKQMTPELLVFNVCFVYMPVVFASVCYNVILCLIKKGKPLHDVYE